MGSSFQSAGVCLLGCLFLLPLLIGNGAGTPPTSAETTSMQKPATLPSMQRTTPLEAEVKAEIPLRLMIPSIQVDAPIETVTTTAEGNLATPIQHPWDDAGWYSPGTLPGQMGSAVIDGHLNRPGGAPAVFWNLKQLRIGDAVLVFTSTGITHHFHITRVAAYQPQDAPMEEIFGNTNGRYLNLITCAGVWVASQGQTTQRLIVFATFDS